MKAAQILVLLALTALLCDVQADAVEAPVADDTPAIAPDILEKINEAIEEVDAGNEEFNDAVETIVPEDSGEIDPDTLEAIDEAIEEVDAGDETFEDAVEKIVPEDSGEIDPAVLEAIDEAIEEVDAGEKTFEDAVEKIVPEDSGEIDPAVLEAIDKAMEEVDAGDEQVKDAVEEIMAMATGDDAGEFDPAELEMIHEIINEVEAAEGTTCVFPFTYEGKEYQSCTKEDSYLLWCATAAEYSPTAWKYCSAEDKAVEAEPTCLFPFTYKGESYEECTDEDSYWSWCSTTDNLAENPNEWIYC